MPHAPDVHLARLADPATMTTLAQLGFEWSASDAQTCAAVRFRRECREPPALVGLLGGASSGKSTLFNSLFEREISQISAHAHETKGPVVAVHVKDLPDVLAWSRAGTLLPGYGTIEIQSAAPTIGRPDATCLYGHSNDDFARRLVVDTPDVTSQSSLAEGSVARTLLPWFDDVIVVVDEERWFDATVFDELIEFSREFGPRLWVVFNQTDGSEALSAADQQRLIDHAINRHAAGSCISPYQPGSGYRPLSADTRRQTARWISSSEPGSRRESLERHLQRRCAEIVRVNVTRSERFAGLRRDVDRALVDLTTETSLSNDLLTPDERELLGVKHRFVPLYGAIKGLRQRMRWFGPARPVEPEIDFRKRTEALAAVLRRNLDHRFSHAADRLTRIMTESAYLGECEMPWRPQWAVPAFDEYQWAVRIRGHIDAWTAEAAKQSTHGDMAALALSVPLLLADLLFLGGAGMTLAWAATWLTGFVGGKGLAALVQRSPAFREYQTTVGAYRAFIREALTEQVERNLASMPIRHLRMSDPLLESLMFWSSPVRA